MNKPLIIFGSGDLAELAHFYFRTDSPYDVAAFTLDARYIRESSVRGLPVVAFEDLTATYPPDSYAIFIALGYSQLNAVRKEKYLAARALGYCICSYISSKATVLNEGRIGANCLILEDTTIQPFVTVGDNVTIWSGSHVGHHSSIGDHTFLAPHVAIAGGVTIGEQCFIGINATLRDHISVGNRCVVGAGTLLLADAEADGLYIGRATERTQFPSTRLTSL